MGDLDINSNALVRIEDYKVFAGISESDENFHPEKVVELIETASSIIENYCNRLFIKPDTAISEYFDGHNLPDFYVKNNRIASGTTPTFQYRECNTWYDLDATTYPIEFYHDKGLCHFIYNKVFDRGSKNWKISYFYGWEIDDIPADLKHCCFQFVQRLGLKSGGREGVTSESFGDGSTTFDLHIIPKDIQMTLDKYKRFYLG